MSCEVTSRLVSGWWRGAGLQTRRVRELPVCYSAERAKVPHTFSRLNQSTRRLTCLLLLVSVVHRICCREAKVTVLRSCGRNESSYQTVRVCIWRLSLMSCLVSVSLSFTVTFHLLLVLLFFFLCITVSASVNSVSPQSAALYWYENKEGASRLKTDILTWNSFSVHEFIHVSDFLGQTSIWNSSASA